MGTLVNSDGFVCVTNVLSNDFLSEALIEKTNDKLSVCDDLLKEDSNEIFVKLFNKMDILDVDT